MSSVKRILITLPKPESGKSPYYDLAEKYGISVDFRSFIRVETVTTREFRDQRINILDHSAIIFTSRTAMDLFFQLAEELRVTIPEEMKYFCINEQIANYLQKFVVYRKRKVFYPNEMGTLNSLVTLIAKHNKENYFIPVAEEHKNDLMQLLTAKKIKYSTGVMYRTVSDELSPEEKQEKYDMFVFFSPASVTSLQYNFPDFEQGSTVFAAFGNSTSNAIQEAGYRLDIMAPQPGVSSMHIALDQYLAE